MKVGLKYGRVICLLALITSLIYNAPVIAGDSLICTESQFSVISLNQDKTKTVLACMDTFESAKASMNTLSAENPDLVITHNSSKSPEKIVASNRAIALSMTYRDGFIRITKDPIDPDDETKWIYTKIDYATLDIYSKDNFTGNSTYIESFVTMDYFDTISYNTQNGSGIVNVKISGFEGYTKLLQLDIIPLIFIEKSWPMTFGGNSYSSSNVKNPYTVIPRMDHYVVSRNTTYNTREIQHRVYKTLPTVSSGIYVYGNAPDWLPDGIFYSWDSINYYYDIEMKMPVMNGDVPGEYYNYYQYLPLRSSSLLTAKQLDDYLIALGFTKKALPPLPRENGASSMFGEGQAFVDGQTKYGVNALLVYAMGLHESGRGTSDISILKNNIFGYGASDLNPLNDAQMYESVSLSIAVQMSRNLRGYLSTEDYRFFGSILGNKNNGFNTKYASDPYWGNKISGWAYRIDRYYNFIDYNQYTLGIVQNTDSLLIKSDADQFSTTLFTIPSRTQQRSILINSIIENTSGNWVSIMSTQPINLEGLPVFYKDDKLDMTKYEWHKGNVYLSETSIKIIYPGNGVEKIPMVYNSNEFDKGPMTGIYSIELINGTINLDGYGFNQGLSVPYTNNVIYKVSLRDESENELMIGLDGGSSNNQLTTDFGQNRFNYDGAVFNGNIDLKNLPEGIYTVELIMEFDLLSKNIIVRKAFEFDGILPTSQNFQGRSYIITRNDDNKLVLEVKNYEINFLVGDVSENDLITVTDLVMLRRYLAGSVVLQYRGMLAADINKDGRITTTDLVLLRRLLAEME